MIELVKKKKKKKKIKKIRSKKRVDRKINLKIPVGLMIDLVKLRLVLLFMTNRRIIPEMDRPLT